MIVDGSAVTRFVDRLVETDRVGGAGIAIAVRGEPVFQYVAGEVRPGVAATEATLWPLASISKLYTAAAVMTLVEAGDLALWTRASAVVPDFTGDGREQITLRQLLTHTSGVPMEPADLEALFQENADLDGLVRHAWTDPLRFAPGTGQHYSDTGMALAGLMAARVAGVDFPELIRTRVLEPAGLRETFVPPAIEQLDRLAYVRGAMAEGTAWGQYTTPYGARTAHPSYGVVATLPDLLRFLLLFDPQSGWHLHAAATRAAMTTDQTNGFEPGETYPQPPGLVPPWGLGFMLKHAGSESGIASPESYGHQGATGCVAWCDPRWKVSVAFVSNRHLRADVDEWRMRVESAVNVALAAVTAG